MRNILILCFAALASASAISATVKTATQPWVEAKIADAVKDAGKVQSVNGKTGAVELAASDVGAVATNDFSAATNALAEAIAKAEPADYANVSNKAMTALQPAATNGLVTASVTNGLASAASVKANAAALAAEKNARESAGYLTAESDPAFAAWKNTTNGCFTAGGNIELHNSYDHIAFGYDIYAEDDTGDGKYNYQSVAFGKNLTLGMGEGSSGIAFGRDMLVIRHGVFIGRHIEVGDTNPSAIAIGYATPAAPLVANGENTFNITTPDPSHFWFNSIQGSTARSLQSYLDERATTKDLEAVKASIPAISATDATFSNAVLAVGLNIDTNAVAQINELLADGAKLPTSGVATVGGLLAALAAGLAALKKKTDDIKSSVDSANAALEEVA